jgi:serine/threonine protein kinase
MTERKMLGHYEIREQIGSGSMGRVYVGLDTYLDRLVAIKTLRPEYAQDPEFITRFLAEAKSLAKLNHPNITTLYSTVFQGPDHYMVMELVRGKTLEDILHKRSEPLTINEALAIISQAADGISYAHQNNTMHRDLKPSNLMIDDSGRVKIMDFGIARAKDSVRLTRVGTAVGTPLYMSPEQCMGERGDERSDLYSLALILYELLSGNSPFSSETEYGIMQAQINQSPSPLSTKVRGITRNFDLLLLKALAKNPAHRFSSVKEFSTVIGASSLRPDSESIIKSSDYLIQNRSNLSSNKNNSSIRSNPISKEPLLQRVKKIHPAYKFLSIGCFFMSAIFVFYIMNSSNLNNFNSVKKNEEYMPKQRQSSQDKKSMTSKDVKINNSVADANTTANKLNSVLPDQEGDNDNLSNNFSVMDLRKAIKGSDSERIKASDFINLSDDVKVQLIQKTLKLASSGDSEAQFVMGMLLAETPGHIDEGGALNALTNAAKQGYPDAQANLGVIYQNGKLRTARDLDKAGYWFRISSENGDAKGQFWLGCYYQFGWGGFARDENKAAILFAKADASHYALANDALKTLRGDVNKKSPCR